jgi:hypothetical protein
MNQTYIYNFWKDTFVQYDRDILDSYSLTKLTKELLCVIGLPVNYEFLNTLNIKFYYNFEQVSVGDKAYVIFGDDYGTKLGVSEQTDQVFSVNLEGEANIRFVNSNIECFLAFLQIILSYQNKAMFGSDDN